VGDKILKEVVWDCETDGLLESLTKLHVFSWKEDEEPIQSTNDPKTIKEVMTQPDTLYIGHNIIGYDLPALRKLGIVDVPWEACADTLGLSWVLFPERVRHGLKQWAEDLGGEKPEVEDWVDVTYEQMCHRCESDVNTNWLLWQKIKEKLNALYSS
jgi:DNA polymerase I